MRERVSDLLYLEESLGTAVGQLEGQPKRLQ
jgi:hypothetical protein